MNPKKVFISGVAGFIGSHLADSYLQKGCHVIGVDNLCSGSVDNVPSRVEFYKLDLIKYEKIVKLLKDVNLVLHTAAHAYDAFSNFAPSIIVNNVISTTSSLLSASIENKVGKFIHFSSMARYGDIKSEIFSEEMLPQPVSPYGIAKYSADLLVKNLCETYNIPYVICIPHNVYGPRQKYNDPFRNVLALNINRFLLNEKPIIYGDGNQKRSFTYIKDCVRAVENIAENRVCKGHLINIGPDKEFVTINHAIKMISQKVNKDFDPIYLEKRINEVMIANCSQSKLNKLLGFECEFSLSQGLDLTIDWIQNKGPLRFIADKKIEIHSQNLPKFWMEY